MASDELLVRIPLNQRRLPEEAANRPLLAWEWDAYVRGLSSEEHEVALSQETARCEANNTLDGSVHRMRPRIPIELRRARAAHEVTPDLLASGREPSPPGDASVRVEVPTEEMRNLDLQHPSPMSISPERDASASTRSEMLLRPAATEMRARTRRFHYQQRRQARSAPPPLNPTRSTAEAAGERTGLGLGEAIVAAMEVMNVTDPQLGAAIQGKSERKRRTIVAALVSGREDWESPRFAGDDTDDEDEPMRGSTGAGLVLEDGTTHSEGYL